MSIAPRITRFVLLSASLYCLAPAACGVVNAQETKVNNQSESHIIVAQSTSPRTPTQPAPSRPRVRFFEEESRFGAGSFVQSALDGVNNTFASDSTEGNLQTNTGSVAADTIQNITLLRNPTIINNLESPSSAIIAGDLTVSNLNLNSPNSLNLTFTSPRANITLSNPVPQAADPRMGTVTVNGFITVNNQTIPFNNVTSNYSGMESFSVNPTTNAIGNVSGNIHVIDPANSTTTFTLALPSTPVPRDIGSRQTVTAPNAQLTIGIPRGR